MTSPPHAEAKYSKHEKRHCKIIPGDMKRVINALGQKLILRQQTMDTGEKEKRVSIYTYMHTL